MALCPGAMVSDGCETVMEISGGGREIDPFDQSVSAIADPTYLKPAVALRFGEAFSPAILPMKFCVAELKNLLSREA